MLAFRGTAYISLEIFSKTVAAISISAWSYIHINGDKQDTAKQYLKQLQTFFVT